MDKDIEKKLNELNDQLNGLTVKFREESDRQLAGKMSASDFKTFETKITTDMTAINDEIVELKKRPTRSLDGEKEQKEGLPEYKKSFMGFIKTGQLKLDAKAEAYMMERKALVSDDTGAIMFPEDLEAEIYREIPKINVIRQYALVQPTARDKRRRRSMTEVEVAYGKLEIGGTPVESSPVPTDDYQYVEDINGLAKLGKDEIADTDAALESIVLDSFVRALAEKEETMFMTGGGHAVQEPEGILNGSVVTRVLTTAADAIIAEDILNLIYAVPRQYRRNGVLLVPSTTELAMRKLRASGDGTHFTGDFLWQPSVQAGKPATFSGVPVENQEDIPAIASATSCDIAVFGDLRAGYRILDRQGMTVQRLVEKFTLAGMIGILVGARNTGGVIRPNAIRILREHS